MAMEAHQQKKGFNAFQLKIWMALWMVLDHLYYIPGLIPDTLTLIFHMLTRCVAVWFAFAAVEGFIYTRSRLRYMLRLFLWAGIMFLGNALLNYLFQDKGVYIHNNIFFTLAVGILVLYILFYDSDQPASVQMPLPLGARIVLALIPFIGGALGGEGGMIIIPFMVITFACRNHPKWRNGLYVILAILLFASSFVGYDTAAATVEMMLYNCDWLFLLVLPLIYLYNGERGPNTRFSKYFFYVFYPAHIWLLATIGYLIQ